MNDYESKIQSCQSFEKDSKTGRIGWFTNYNPSTPHNYHAIVNHFKVTVWLCPASHVFGMRFEPFDIINKQLKATTAHDACLEALQVVKNEAKEIYKIIHNNLI